MLSKNPPRCAGGVEEGEGEGTGDTATEPCPDARRSINSFRRGGSVVPPPAPGCTSPERACRMGAECVEWRRQKSPGAGAAGLATPVPPDWDALGAVRGRLPPCGVRT
jgi:hypothetical protein